MKIQICKACGSTQKLRPAFRALGKMWCGHCGGKLEKSK